MTGSLRVLLVFETVWFYNKSQKASTKQTTYESSDDRLVSKAKSDSACLQSCRKVDWLEAMVDGADLRELI
jgi:hypothetical protein